MMPCDADSTVNVGCCGGGRLANSRVLAPGPEIVYMPSSASVKLISREYPSPLTGVVMLTLYPLGPVIFHCPGIKYPSGPGPKAPSIFKPEYSCGPYQTSPAGVFRLEY